MTQPSWVALRGMAHSFIELDKAVAHVISLISLIRQDEKEMTKDEMVGWHHQLDEHEFEQGLVMDREAWHVVVRGGAKVRHD